MEMIVLIIGLKSIIIEFFSWNTVYMNNTIYMAGYVNMKTGDVSILDSIPVGNDKIYSSLIRPTLYENKYENFAYDIQLKEGLVRISKNLELDCKLLEDGNIQILLNYIKINKGYLYNTSGKTLLYSFFVKKIESKTNDVDDAVSVACSETFSEVPIITFTPVPIITFSDELKEKVTSGKYPLEQLDEVIITDHKETEFQKELHEAVQKRLSRVKSREIKKKNKRLKKKS
jgi:hypothetical protein